jgi:putative membrane protein
VQKLEAAVRFLVRWLVSSIAVAAAVALVPGITVSGNAWVAVLVSALVIGLINATLGLIFKIGAIGCILMTFGLFALVINALMLLLSEWLLQLMGVGFSVEGFWPAFWGGIVISVVSAVLGWFLPYED